MSTLVRWFAVSVLMTPLAAVAAADSPCSVHACQMPVPHNPASICERARERTEQYCGEDARPASCNFFRESEGELCRCVGFCAGYPTLPAEGDEEGLIDGFADAFAADCDCGCAEDLEKAVASAAEAAGDVCEVTERMVQDSEDVETYTDLAEAIGYGQIVGGAYTMACGTVRVAKKGPAKVIPKGPAKVCDYYMKARSRLKTRFPDPRQDASCSQLARHVGKYTGLKEIVSGCEDVVRGAQRVDEIQRDRIQLRVSVGANLRQSLGVCLRLKEKEDALRKIQGQVRDALDSRGSCGSSTPFLLP